MERTRYLRLIQSLEQAVVAALRGAGVQVELSAPLDEGSFVLERGGHRYVAELRVCREPRREALRAHLADAILRARAAAAVVDGARPLALLGTSRLSEALAADVRRYAERYSPGEAFGLLDAEGRLELHGAGLEDVAASPRTPASPRRAAADLFSDRNQWLLKVLLGRRLGLELPAAAKSDVLSASQLARAGQVSVASAARLVAALRVERFLEGGRGGLRLIAVDALLERWRLAVGHRAAYRQRAARWELPATDPRKQLRSALAASSGPSGLAHAPFELDVPVEAPPRACLGLFAACELRGVPVPKGAPRHLYLEEDSPSALGALGLRGAEPGEVPHLLIRVPRWPEAVFRGASRVGGTPVADLLQCWLDLCAEPTAAAELTQTLWRRLHLGGDTPHAG